MLRYNVTTFSAVPDAVTPLRTEDPPAVAEVGRITLMFPPSSHRAVLCAYTNTPSACASAPAGNTVRAQISCFP